MYNCMPALCSILVIMYSNHSLLHVFYIVIILRAMLKLQCLSTWILVACESQAEIFKYPMYNLRWNHKIFVEDIYMVRSAYPGTIYQPKTWKTMLCVFSREGGAYLKLTCTFRSLHVLKDECEGKNNDYKMACQWSCKET